MTAPHIADQALAHIRTASLCVGCQHLFVPGDDGGLDFGTKSDGTQHALGYCARCWAQLRSTPAVAHPWEEALNVAESQPDSEGHF